MAITRDQLSTLTASAGITSPGSVTITFGTLPTAGSSVIVAIGINFNSATPAISSVQDNGTTPSTFTQDLTETGSANHVSRIYRADGITLPSSGSYTVTVTLTGSGSGVSISAGAASYLSKAPGGPVSTNVATATSTSITTNSATPASSGSLFIATFQDNSSGTTDNVTVTNANFTSRLSQSSGASSQVYGFADQIQAGGPAADTCTWSVATSATYSAAIAVYSPAASASAPPLRFTPVPPGRFSPGSFPRIQPPPPPGVPNVLAPAGAGPATATALGPVANVIPAPAAASATAAALNPTVVITPSPAAASATATAQGPVPNVIPAPAAASATATAQGPAILTGTIANPAAATATATAQSPALQISNSVTPGVAHATATALNPVVVITPNAGLAHATATAQSPSVQVSTTVTPGVAQATASASSPGFARPLNNFGVTFTEPGPTATLTENDFGAVLTEQKFGAALTLASFGGSLTPVSPSATCTTPGFGATLTTPAFSAVLTEGTMQQASLTLSEFNDMTINIAVTNNGSPYNLTSQNLNLLLKSQAGVPDSQALVFSSTGGSPAITITNAAQGLATAQLPNTSLNSETYNFYRLDVVNASLQQQTTVYGPIVWVTL